MRRGWIPQVPGDHDLSSLLSGGPGVVESIGGSRSKRHRIGLEVAWLLTDAVAVTASRGVGYRW
jgi:hypothetical protein